MSKVNFWHFFTDASSGMGGGGDIKDFGHLLSGESYSVRGHVNHVGTLSSFCTKTWLNCSCRLLCVMVSKSEFKSSSQISFPRRGEYEFAFQF